MVNIIREEITHPDGTVEIREYPEPQPAPEPVPQEVTETQFIRATVKAGFITWDEGAGYLARGELPLMMTAALAKIPAEVRDDMTLKAIGSASFSRSDPVFLALVGAGVATDGQIDDVFRLAASLT